MAYIAFARKYRPQTFDDILGQPHVTTTLKNAISQERTAHAYIFAGPRGVGKTTTARMLARALNCEKGPTPKPCGSCASCREIARGMSLDILEIDGASNRGIDEIRNLRDNVKFSPSKGRFKIYIIDEVHMLTEPAFNALLKTLEEPPPHVKFIFATTKAYKIPPTILSRCQRFDFRRIAAREVFESLKAISRKEGLKVNDDVLELIARYSEGSLRDAQVTLDQMASFSGDKIEAEDVRKALGVFDDDVMSGLSRAIAEKDASGALRIIDTFLSEGKDVTQAVLSLIEHFRNISIAKVSDEAASLIDAGPERVKYYETESKKFTIEEILYIIHTLSNTIDFIRKSGLPRIPLEAAMIKLTKMDSIMSLPEILDRINGLAAGTGTSVPKIAPRRETDPPPPSAGQAPPGLKPGAGQAKALPEAKETVRAELDEILSAWSAVMDYIRPKKISVASYLEEGYPVSLEGENLTIGFPKECQFHKEVLESPDNRRLIEEGIRESLKLDLRAVLVLVEPVNAPGGRGALRNGGNAGTGPAAGEPGEPKKEVDPIIKSALEVFGGDIADGAG